MRFWVMGTFSALALQSACAWNIYGPLSFAARELYGWDDNQIAWVVNTANVAQLLCVPLAQLAVDAYGCRTPTLACALIMLVSSLLRCVPHVCGLAARSPDILLVMTMSMVLNGMAASWLNFAGPIISAHWFSADQRALATSVLSVTPYIGVSLGFVSPMLVPESGFPPSCSLAAEGCWGASRLRLLYQTHVAFTLLVSLAVWLMFPERANPAPSLSAALSAAASKRRSAAGVGVRALLCCDSASALRLWAVAVAFAVPVGVFVGWGAVLALNLAQYGIDAEAAGVLGCAMTLFGCVGGTLGGYLADRFQGQMKGGVLLCYGLATLGFAAFALLVHGHEGGRSRTPLYAAGVVGGCFLNAPTPLFFELAMETAFGSVSDGAGTALLGGLLSLVQVVFLAVSFAPPLAASSEWMNWAMCLVIPLAATPLALMRVRYPRLDVDCADGAGVRAGCLDRRGYF